MIGTHRGAFEYEWRARFGLSLRVVGESMTWGEAFRLTQILARDPSSHVFAAIAKWDYPITREDLTLRDLYDLTQVGRVKRLKPYQRPWEQSSGRRATPGKKVTQAQIVAALQKAGHTAPLPMRAEASSG